MEQVSQNQSDPPPYGISAEVTALHVRVSYFNAYHGHWNLPCIKILGRNPFHCKNWLELEKDESKIN